MPAIAGKAVNVFFSSSALNNPNFQVDSEGNNGWSPSGRGDAFVGVTSTILQTYYALDVKSLQGSTLSSFALQFSLDGNRYQDIDDFQMGQYFVGSVKTFYFKPVYAKSIRLVVRQGTPNIKFEFYYSNASSLGQEVRR